MGNLFHAFPALECSGDDCHALAPVGQVAKAFRRYSGDVANLLPSHSNCAAYCRITSASAWSKIKLRHAYIRSSAWLVCQNIISKLNYFNSRTSIVLHTKIYFNRRKGIENLAKPFRAYILSEFIDLLI